MKRIGFINILVLALASGLCLLIATASDGEVASVELRHPTTVLHLVTNRLHTLRFYVTMVIDGGTASFREAVGKHERPKTALEQ